MILKLNFDHLVICLKAVTLVRVLNPRVCCTFGNVSFVTLRPFVWTLKQRALCKVAFMVILKSRLPRMHILGWKLEQWAWCIEPYSLNKCFYWKDFAGKALWLNGLPGLRWGASAVALAAIPNPLWFIASTALCLYEGVYMCRWWWWVCMGGIPQGWLAEAAKTHPCQL